MLTADEVAVVLLAITLGGLVKSVSGMGMPLIATPLMSLWIPTDVAIAVIALPTVLHNLLMAVGHRSHRHGTRGLIGFCAIATLGAATGAYLLTAVDEWILEAALVAMIAWYLAATIANPGLTWSAATERRGTAPAALLSGLFQGSIGVSGPVVVMWWQGHRLHRDAFVFAITLVFCITGATQSAVLAGRGRFAGLEWVIVAATAIVFATIPIGRRIRDRLPVRRFEQLILLLLTVSGASLAVGLLGQAG